MMGRDSPLHARIDRALAGLSRPLGGLYPEGFGADLDERVDAVRALSGPAEPVEVHWDPARRALGVAVRSGWLASPAAGYLPPESRRALVEEWLPAPGAPICLLLATTGEEGFGRRRALAGWLAAHGIGSLLLENPFYGVRRPSGQRGALLRTVADQFAMNLATVEEAAALLRTFHDLGHDVGATGYSQGGMMAAFAAALSDFSVAVVPRGAARAAGPVFTDSALAKTMRWDVLAAEAGGHEAARERFLASLEPVRADRLPVPRDTRRAIIVASRHDGFIPASEVEALHQYWPGSELRWVEGGHVTGLLLHHDVHRRAVIEAFGRPAASLGG